MHTIKNNEKKNELFAVVSFLPAIPCVHQDHLAFSVANPFVAFVMTFYHLNASLDQHSY